MEETIVNKPGKYKGGRPKRDYRSASKENYKRFCLEHPTVKITFKEYEAIIRTWNKKFATYCLDTGNKVTFPFGFGPIAINRKKSERFFTDKNGVEHCILPTDWKATLDDKENPEHKKIYILNHHTEGYGFKWYWFKGESKIKLPDVWAFQPAKTLKNLLTKYLTDPKTKHYLKYREYAKRKIPKSKK